MITINGVKFYDVPGSCGTCPFFSCGRTEISQGSDSGHCRMFNENHRRWINPPRRCLKLFRKGLKYPDGTELVIVANENGESDG